VRKMFEKFMIPDVMMGKACGSVRLTSTWLTGMKAGLLWGC
jgi:hypothetical protein